MPKRKKYPKLPNGYGSIKYLGKGRRNPYAVHPPTTEFTLDGVPITPKALCYVDDWMKGFAVLTAYKAGTYQPGMEKTLEFKSNTSNRDSNTLVGRILADYSTYKGICTKKEKTFKEVYDEFFNYKYLKDKGREYSKSTIAITKSAFKNCSTLHDKVFRNIKHADLQEVLDNCSCGYGSIQQIMTLLHQLFEYAEIYELCDHDYSAHLKINQRNNIEHGTPFSDEELKILWCNKDDPIIELILIMCYSGYRITAYKSLYINLEEKYFQGGIKNNTSKNRIVPIHSSIFPLVEQRLKRGPMLQYTTQWFRSKMGPTLECLGLSNHTPHDCRHTFSRLCEKYKVNENDRRRMLGHSFGADITNAVYGHRSLDDLRKEIEKIKICY